MVYENTARYEDRRVRRTKKVLRDSLFRLLEEKPVNKITVKELTTLAEINRSTFYFYYKDVTDMVTQLQDEIFAKFEKEVLSARPELLTTDDFTRYIRTFLDFIAENEDICRFAVDNDVVNALSDRIRAGLIGTLPDTTAAFAEEDPRRYITSYGMNGTWSAIIDWLHDGMKTPPGEFARFLAKIYFYGGRALVLGE